MNWFYCKSRDLSINLNLVTEIWWEQLPGITRVFYLQSTIPSGEFGEGINHPFTDITDENDRIALRKTIFSNNSSDEWKPSQKSSIKEATEKANLLLAELNKSEAENSI